MNPTWVNSASERGALKAGTTLNKRRGRPLLVRPIGKKSVIMGQQDILAAVVENQLRTDHPVITIGDTINVHRRIIEGEKQRIQVYQGVLIARHGRGINESITVRRIVANEGVEVVFPLHSPRIAKIEVVRRGDARRAKLYFLRERVGKSRRLRDQRRGLAHLASTAAPTGGAKKKRAARRK